MSWRAIHDTAGRSESLAALDDRAERLYWRLLAHSDAYGRLRATPAKLRATCYPLLAWTDDQVADALEQLANVRRITLYDTADGPAIELVDFEANQLADLKRKRGAPKIPGPNDAGSTADHACPRAVVTNWGFHKTPAQDHKGSPRAAHDGPRASERREEERRQKHQQGTHDARESGAGTDPRARATPTPAAAGDELLELLDELGVTGGLRMAACQDVDRAIACARATLERAQVQNRGAYFRELLTSGDWPAPPAPPTASAPAAPRAPRDPAAAIAAMIRNGAIADPLDLDAELRAEGLDELAAARLRALLDELHGRADSGQETPEPLNDAASVEREQERTAPGHHADETEPDDEPEQAAA